jgi:hypothetical protein
MRSRKDASKKKYNPKEHHERNHLQKSYKMEGMGKWESHIAVM